MTQLFSMITTPHRALLHTFMSSGSQPFYRMSADWKVMESLLGKGQLPDIKLSTSGWLENFIVKEDVELIIAAIQEAISEKKVFCLKHRLITADLSVRWVESKAIPIFNDYQEIIEWYGTFTFLESLEDGHAVPSTDKPVMKVYEQALPQQDIVEKIESKYRVLFNSMDEGYCIIQMIYDDGGKAVDWKFIEVNPAFERHNGLVNAAGKTMRQMEPNIEQKWVDIYNKVAESGESIRFQEDSFALHRTFDLYAFRIGQAEERLVAVLFTDISERKKSERRQAFLLKLNEALRWLNDPEKIQEEAARILGHELKAARAYYFSVEKKGDQYIHHVARDYYRMPGMPSVAGRLDFAIYGRHIYERLQLGEILQIEDIFRPDLIKDIEMHAYIQLGVHALIVVPLVKNSKYVAAFAVNDNRPRAWTAEDVKLVQETAERTWAAVELARSQEALKNSEKLLASIFQLAPIGIGLAEPSGKFIFYNEMMKSFIPNGIIPSKDKSVAGRWIGYLPDGSRLRPEDYPGLRALRGDGEGAANEMLYVKEDGSAQWTRVAAIPLQDDDGKVSGIVAVITDIDALKRTTEKLLEGERQLKELLRQKDEFLAVASHELKTPVTSMIVFADIALKTLQEGGHTYESNIVEKLVKQLERLTKLIHNLLDTTRIVSGQLQLSLAPLDLAELIRERVDELSKTSSHSLEFKNTVLPILFADRERIGQVMTNLLSNAIKYSPSGTAITVSTHIKDGFVWINVSDQGYGIAEQDQPYLFRQYFRVKADHVYTQQGMGLGLFITCQIVERHGGNITVKSEPNKGSTFSFSLPIHQH